MPHHTKCAGPGGAIGVLLWDQPRLAPYQPVYRPEEQVWRKARKAFAPTRTWHLGHYQGALPTAEDLARAESIDGVELDLAGQRWLSPVVVTTLPNGSRATRLPSYVDFDDDGEAVQGDVVDEHAWLLDCVAPFWDAWLAGYEATDAGAQEFRIPMPKSAAVDAARLLSANYRIGPMEAAQLRLTGASAPSTKYPNAPIS